MLLQNTVFYHSLEAGLFLSLAVEKMIFYNLIYNINHIF